MLSRQEYKTEINELALELWNDALKDANDDKDEALDLVRDLVHQCVDGHMWVIYNCYHHLVLHYSNNYTAYENVFDYEHIGRIVAEHGVDALHMSMTYHAMEADIFDAIYEVLAA